MHMLLFMIVTLGFALVVILGALSVVTDFLALTRHRPPSIFDAFKEEDPESDSQKSEDRNRQTASTYAVESRARRTIPTDINAGHWADPLRRQQAKKGM
jgi:hypothetical protein